MSKTVVLRVFSMPKEVSLQDTGRNNRVGNAILQEHEKTPKWSHLIMIPCQIKDKAALQSHYQRLLPKQPHLIDFQIPYTVYATLAIP